MIVRLLLAVLILSTLPPADSALAFVRSTNAAQQTQWSTTALSTGRSEMVSASVGSKVLFAGGEVERARPSATVDQYEATTGTWSTAKLTKPGWGFTATAVGTHALFVGCPSVDGGIRYSTAVDVYDSAAEQ